MLIIGLGLLILGAEALVRGSSALALHLGMRPLLIGMTVVAFGTSMPEMVVSVQAVFSGQAGIALGNVIGSNICNLGLILGLSAVIRPLAVQSQTIRLDVPVMIVSAIILILFLFSSGLSRLEGIVQLAFMGLFLGYSIVNAGKDCIHIHSADLGVGDIRHWSFIRIISYILCGLVGLIPGAHLLIRGAVGLARSWGVSETVIGLTLVAVGTSLPELATSLLAAFRRESDIAVGNVIGSNIFNTLAILGVASIIKPFPDLNISWSSLGSMLILSLLCLPFFKSGFRLSRIEGFILIIIYGLYSFIMFY
ncbi:calcium/sodium antiporter [bacterium]|nr:calcium/sodium antiporter [bacterium]